MIYDQPSRLDVKCSVCHKIMSYESNVFVLNFFCTNPKCNAYLKRSGGYGKSANGKIRIDSKLLTKKSFAEAIKRSKYSFWERIKYNFDWQGLINDIKGVKND